MIHVYDPMRKMETVNELRRMTRIYDDAALATLNTLADIIEITPARNIQLTLETASGPRGVHCRLMTFHINFLELDVSARISVSTWEGPDFNRHIDRPRGVKMVDEDFVKVSKTLGLHKVKSSDDILKNILRALAIEGGRLAISAAGLKKYKMAFIFDPRRYTGDTNVKPCVYVEMEECKGAKKNGRSSTHRKTALG